MRAGAGSATHINQGGWMDGWMRCYVPDMNHNQENVKMLFFSSPCIFINRNCGVAAAEFLSLFCCFFFFFYQRTNTIENKNRTSEAANPMVMLYSKDLFGLPCPFRGSVSVWPPSCQRQIVPIHAPSEFYIRLAINVKRKFETLYSDVNSLLPSSMSLLHQFQLYIITSRHLPSFDGWYPSSNTSLQMIADVFGGAPPVAMTICFLLL